MSSKLEFKICSLCLTEGDGRGGPEKKYDLLGEGVGFSTVHMYLL